MRNFEIREIDKEYYEQCKKCFQKVHQISILTTVKNA